MIVGSLACLITLPAFIGLITLLLWTSFSNIFGNPEEDNNDGQGGNNGEWNWDMNREKMVGVKIVLNLVVLVIACATLLVPISSPSSQFNNGALASSLFMFGNMLFISFWYQMNFENREEDRNNGENEYYGGGYYNAYWYQNIDGRELLEYHQKVMSYVCLAFALLYFAISTCTYGWARSQPGQLVSSDSINAQNHAQLTVQFDLLSEIWKVLSLSTIVVFVALSIASLLMLGSEDADRMMKDNNLIGLIVVNCWMSVVALFMMFWGNETFVIKRGESLCMGMLYGGTKYYSALLFLICIMFANLSFDEGDRDEKIWVSTATALACLVLSFVHFGFASKAREYQANVHEATDKDGSDFVRVDEQLA